MSVDNERIKTIDDRTKLLVFGYIRKSFQNSPDLVIFTCLSFYFIREYFATKGKYTKISSNGNVIEKITDDGWGSMAYGNIEITNKNKGIYEWHLDIIDDKSHIVIGIASGIHISSSFHGSSKSYGLWSANGNRINTFCRDRTYSKKFGKGSIVIIELDMTHHEKKKLSFIINGKNEGVAFDNVSFKTDDTTYRLAVNMYYPGAKVKIIKFVEISA